MHSTKITKTDGMYEVLCQGDYDDLYFGRNTGYLIAEYYFTKKEALSFKKKQIQEIEKTYKAKGKEPKFDETS